MIKEIEKEHIKKLEQLFPDVFKNQNILTRLDNNEFTNYFVIEENNNLIGFINFDIIYDRAELIDINIKEEYQNKGYASKLMNFMLEYITEKKVSSITLEVRYDNYNAIHLYKKYGFEEISIRKGYYDDKDAILMERKMM